MNDSRATPDFAYSALGPVTLADLITLLVGSLLLIVVAMPAVPQRINGWILGGAVVGFVALQLYATRAYLSRSTAVDHSTTLKLLLAFFVVVILGSLKAWHAELGAREILRDVGPLALLLFAFPIADVVNNATRRRLISTSLLLGGAYVAAFTIWGVASNFPPPRLLAPSMDVRLFIILNNDAIFLPLFIGGFAMAVAERRYAVTRGRRRLMSLLLLAMLFAAYLAMTRSLYLGLGVVLLSPLTLQQRLGGREFWVRLGIAAVLCAIFLVVLFGSGLEAFDREIDLDSPAVQKRLAETRSTLAAIGDEPLLGRGPGYILVTQAPEYDLLRRRTYTHNLFTYLLLHYGVVGVLVFVLLLLQTIATHVRAFNATEDRTELVLVFGSLVGLLGILVYVQFQAIYKSFSFMAYLAFALGTAARFEASLLKRQRDEGEAGR